jgi:hypothetical protein
MNDAMYEVPCFLEAIQRVCLMLEVIISRELKATYARPLSELAVQYEQKRQCNMTTPLM